jgi:AcrR family transcriptional regulator
MPETPPAPEQIPASERSRPQLSPQDWIAAAMSHLVNHPIDAVRVDVLAKQIGMTRGSFYWHFTDREDLLQRLLQTWRKTTTEQVIARFQNASSDPATVLRGLLELPTHGRTAAQASKVELAIREWARRDDTARAVLEEVDNQRLGYFAECFAALGHNAEEARHRAFMLYGHLLSDSLLPHDEAQRKARLVFVQRLLVPAQAG